MITQFFYHTLMLYFVRLPRSPSLPPLSPSLRGLLLSDAADQCMAGDVWLGMPVNTRQASV